MAEKTDLRILKIFVAWPSDVAKERDRVENVINDLNKSFYSSGFHLEMLDWRKVPPGAGNPEDVIIETTNPSSWHVFIGILWKRFGHPPGLDNPLTGQPYKSGFEFEVDRAYNLWKKSKRPRIMIYRCMRPIPPKEHDPEQFIFVQNFFKDIEEKKEKEILYKEYYDPLGKFETLLKDDLRKVVEEIISKPMPLEIIELSDREYELSRIRALLFTHPETSILVRASAGKGKSWFMEKLYSALKNENNGSFIPSFYCLKLDCRNDIGIRVSLKEMLLCIYRQLLPREPELENPRELLQAITHQVGTTLTSERKRLVLLFDHVEFLLEECRIYLKDTLLPELWKVAGKLAYYPTIIAFSRFHPLEWHGETVRFETVDLLPFHNDAIEKMLRQKTKDQKLEPFSDPVYANWASQILQISHGHASCILKLISSFSDRSFVKPADLDSAKTFMNFVYPVVFEEILNDDNLAPFELVGKKIFTANRLRKILPYVCFFRFYSLAQLRILAYCGIITSEEIEDVADLLNHTLLLDTSIPQAWCKFPESIRRLLADSLYHQNQEDFNKLNQTVCECYDAWITGAGSEKLLTLLGKNLQDHEQIYYVVESLYHHSLTKKGSDLVASLKNLMEIYLEHLRGNFSRKYLMEALIRSMRQDGELEQLLRYQSKTDEFETLNDYQALVSFVEKRFIKFK